MDRQPASLVGVEFRGPVQRLRSSGDKVQPAVVIAVVAMDMVQMAIDEVVRVIAVWYGLVTAAGSVNVRPFVAGAAVRRRAVVRIRWADLNAMVVNVVAVGMVQVAVVKIIRVALVFHCRMATLWAMLVAVSAGMLLVRLGHWCSLPFQVWLTQPRDAMKFG